MSAFDEGPIGELILHPPPISTLSCIILPVLLFRNHKIGRTIAKIYSYTMHWMENITVLILLNLFYEIMLVPICWMKVFLNLFWANFGLFTWIFFIGVWFLFGLLVLCFFIIRDTAYMFYILYMHEGCKSHSKVQVIDEKE